MAFNLEKEAEKVKFQLEKKGLKDVVAAVGLDIDVSGSTKGLFQRGLIQGVVQRIMPVALNFDDNGELDVWAFADEDRPIAKVENASRRNFDGFVERHILNARGVPLWGGTDYAPVLRANLEEYGFFAQPVAPVPSGGLLNKLFSKPAAPARPVLQARSKTGYPAVIQFVTDGANSDRNETRSLLQACQDVRCQIYFNFVGVNDNPREFGFIQELADEFDNVGFFQIRDLQSAVGDDAIYDLLVPEELVRWLKK